MKRFFAILAALALMAVLAINIRNASDTPLLRVMLRPRGEENATCTYETVFASGKSRSSDEFTSDHIAIYTADYADFDFSLPHSDTLNRLVDTVLYNAHGEEIHPDKTMIAMMHAASQQIDHVIYDFQIVVDNERYFAFVKLNVNWWVPCVLYEFDLTTGELKELCTWNDMDLVGLALG